MALDANPKQFRDHKITLIDGTTPTAVELDVACVQAFTSPVPENEDIEIRCRGTVTHVLDDDPVVYDLTFTAVFYEHTNATAGVPADFMLARNGYSGNASTSTVHKAKNMFDVKVTTDKTSGQTTDPSVTHNDCVLMRQEIAPGKPTQITYTVRVYGGQTEAGEA